MPWTQAIMQGSDRMVRSDDDGVKAYAGMTQGWTVGRSPNTCQKPIKFGSAVALTCTSPLQARLNSVSFQVLRYHTKHNHVTNLFMAHHSYTQLHCPCVTLHMFPDMAIYGVSTTCIFHFTTCSFYITMHFLIFDIPSTMCLLPS